ncbi:hypothetical protein Cgig2_021429 [Carnegiea gigantea]|uniref:Aminotransferase-like plant mobile domain-containing protein n=1 Tax=Carnegiea gigantea TaxID=171969 RepID=A0A9Q1JJA0_9CARY|nr:hypothetical protein Cgig2_021429 [Carnegiea gigantea]
MCTERSVVRHPEGSSKGNGIESGIRAPLEVWNLESKCFKLGRKEVPFSYFDVALLMGLPATVKHITFKRSNGAREVEEVLKGARQRRVSSERQRRRIVQKDMRIYKNYVSVLLELCRVNNTVEIVTLLVVSGLLFPQSAGGVAWDLVHIMEDVDGVREYNWSEAVWEFLVQAMEQSQEKIQSTKNLQINGIYAFADEKRVPRLSSWVNFYKGKKYHTGVVVRELKDSEIIQIIEVRDKERRIPVVQALVESEEYEAYVEDVQVSRSSYICDSHNYVRNGCYQRGGMATEGEGCPEERKRSTCEGEAHEATKRELEELKEAVALNSTVEDILEFARMQRAPDAVGLKALEAGVQAGLSSPLVPSDVADTMVVQQTMRMADMGSNPIDDEIFIGEGATRIRTISLPQNPSVLQSSPCLHLDRALGKGKGKCANVYTSHKRSKKHGSGLAPSGKGGDESDLASLATAVIDPDVQPLVDEGLSTGQVPVDDVVTWKETFVVGQEGPPDDAAGTGVSADKSVTDIQTSIDQVSS